MSKGNYYPNTVQFELVQGCNRKCEFCGTVGMERKLHYITPQVLKKQCDLIRGSGKNPRILLAGHGENTLHPEFFSCIKVMRKFMPNQWIQLLNNGYLIKKDIRNIARMWDAGLNDVTMDEYSDSRFDHAELESICKAYEKKTGIPVDFEIMGAGCNLYAPKNIKRRRLLVVPPIDVKEITMSRKLTNHCGAGSPPDTSCKDKVCTRIFREMSFRWDGSVCICCQDFRGQYFVENAMNVETFDELWFHERFEAARRITFHDKRTFFPCSICDHIPMRCGLLPDKFGKDEMPKPTKADYKTVNTKFEPRVDIILREWEK
jgi:hypothetical protein